MVLLSRSAPLLTRSLGATAAAATRARCSSRALHGLSAARATSLASSRFGVAAASQQPALLHRGGPMLVGKSSTRMLTTGREKVKVLLVLYDGKQHAIDVSYETHLSFLS